MSYSQLYVFRDGEAEPDERFSNGFGSSFMIWGALLHRYESIIFPGRPSYLIPPNGLLDGGFEKLWSTKIEFRPWEAMVLQFTYDGALCRAKDLEHLADCLERFEDAHSRPGAVCHLLPWAKRIRALIWEDIASGASATGWSLDAVGLYGHSASQCHWEVEDESDPEERRGFNLSTDKNFFWIDPKATTLPPQKDSPEISTRVTLE